MTLKRTSHSMCEVFDGCLLQGYFKYLIKAPPEPRFKDYAFTGSYVHNCIEPWFKNYAQGDYSFSGMVYPEEHFTNMMQSIYHENSDTIMEEEDDKAILLCLDNFVDFMARRLKYLQRKSMADLFLPILVEKEYEATINGVPLHGYLDAGFRDERLWLFDWKSNKDPKITGKYVKQAIRYVLLAEASGDFEEPINDFYIINLRNKVDLNKAHVIITDEMKKEQEAELAKIWALMNGTHFPKPSHKKNCFFCEYKMRCLAYPLEGATYKPTIGDEAAPHIECEATAITTDLVETVFEDLGIIKPVNKPDPLDITDLDNWL